MHELRKFITINDLPYEEQTFQNKKLIDRFIEKLQEEGLVEKLRPFIEDRSYVVYPATQSFTNNLPKDLSTQVDRVWVQLLQEGASGG